MLLARAATKEQDQSSAGDGAWECCPGKSALPRSSKRRAIPPGDFSRVFQNADATSPCTWPPSRGRGRVLCMSRRMACDGSSNVVSVRPAVVSPSCCDAGSIAPWWTASCSNRTARSDGCRSAFAGPNFGDAIMLLPWLSEDEKRLSRCSEPGEMQSPSLCRSPRTRSLGLMQAASLEETGLIPQATDSCAVAAD